MKSRVLITVGAYLLAVVLLVYRLST